MYVCRQTLNCNHLHLHLVRLADDFAHPALPPEPTPHNEWVEATKLRNPKSDSAKILHNARDQDI